MQFKGVSSSENVNELVWMNGALDYELNFWIASVSTWHSDLLNVTEYFENKFFFQVSINNFTN